MTDRGWDVASSMLDRDGFLCTAQVELKRARRLYLSAYLLEVRLAPHASPAVGRALVDAALRHAAAPQAVCGRTGPADYAALLIDVEPAPLAAPRLRELAGVALSAASWVTWDGGESVQQLLLRARRRSSTNPAVGPGSSGGPETASRSLTTGTASLDGGGWDKPWT